MKQELCKATGAMPILQKILEFFGYKTEQKRWEERWFKKGGQKTLYMGQYYYIMPKYPFEFNTKEAEEEYYSTKVCLDIVHDLFKKNDYPPKGCNNEEWLQRYQELRAKHTEEEEKLFREWEANQDTVINQNQAIHDIKTEKEVRSVISYCCPEMDDKAVEHMLCKYYGEKLAKDIENDTK